MNSKVLIEAIGYTGSALVLISFLMVSVVKLRIVNTIGSIIFTIYAFIIHSYPTAIMNLCLVLINIYYLVKMSNTSQNTRSYDLVRASVNDAMLKYTIDRQKDDIEKCFPGISLDFKDADKAYIVCHKGTPAGIFVGKRVGDGDIDILLDYSLPEYRDFSIGRYLFSQLKSEGITSLTYSGPDTNHRDYLEKNGFSKNNNSYVKVL
jgi:hypothetical protein